MSSSRDMVTRLWITTNNSFHLACSTAFFWNYSKRALRFELQFSTLINNEPLASPFEPSPKAILPARHTYDYGVVLRGYKLRGNIAISRCSDGTRASLPAPPNTTFYRGLKSNRAQPTYSSNYYRLYCSYNTSRYSSLSPALCNDQNLICNRCWP